MNQQVGNQGYQPLHQRQTSSGAPYVPSQQISAAEYQQQQQFHLLPPMNHPPPPLQHHHEHAHAHQQPMQQAHLHLLQSFWMSQMHDVENVPQDFKLHHLPLARIKKVMKTDDDVKAKMISAEAPMLFDRGCEIFITELTLRAWIHAEENKRRTLQRSDIAAAIVKTDMFDFLIDIVPREEYKMSVAKEPKANYHHHPTAEQRRSQDMFMPPPTSAEPNLAGALEGYGYPYILENEAFSMGMDPNQQQQQQQQQQHQQHQLQMQYMGINPQQAI